MGIDIVVYSELLNKTEKKTNIHNIKQWSGRYGCGCMISLPLKTCLV